MLGGLSRHSVFVNKAKKKDKGGGQDDTGQLLSGEPDRRAMRKPYRPRPDDEDHKDPKDKDR